MSRILISALKSVCDELESFSPNSPALHYARGVLACGPTPARVKPSREPRAYSGRYLPQAEQIVADYVGGKTLLEVGTEYGCGPNLVKRLLNERGIACRFPGPATPTNKKDGPDPRVPEFMAMRANGATLEEIGQHFKLTRERVRQLIVKAGLSEQFAERPFKPEEIAILQEYANGDPLPMTANKLGVSQVTARQWLERAGITIRPSVKSIEGKKLRDAAAAKIARLYTEGLTAKAIADQFGFKKPEQIYRYLAIAGVKASRSSHRPLSVVNQIKPNGSVR